MSFMENQFKQRMWWDGKKFHLKQPEKLNEWGKTLKPDTWVEMIVVPPLSQSEQQELYFHWRDIIAKYLGYTPAEMHEHFKKEYLGGRSTKILTTEAWIQFLDVIKVFANEHNIYLPLKTD